MTITTFAEKLDRWITALTAIPVFGIIIKKVFDKIGEKGAEKIHERVEKILGFDLEKAKKDVSDEIIYGIVVNALNDMTKEDEMDALEARLRREDKEKAEALVLYVAKMVMRFERDIKETVNPPKGSSDPKIEQAYKSIQEGIGHAKNFLESLLRKTGADAEETFQVRVAFLQGKNVFSLVKEKKAESQFSQKMKEIFSDGKGKFVDTIKGIISQAKEERLSFSDDCKSFKERAKAFYEKSKGGKK